MTSSESLTAQHIYVGQDGHSHLERIELNTDSSDLVPPGFTTHLESDALALWVMRWPPNWFVDAHPSPKNERELVIGVGGYTAGEFHSGKTYRTDKGDIMIVNDPTGTGHTSRAGPDGATVLFIRLPA